MYSNWYSTRFTVVLIAFSFFVVPLQAQITRYVATTGNDQGGANTCSDPDAPCRTVTQGIYAANAGDSVHVAAGAYTEAITIDKSLSLQGAGPAVTILQASTVAPGNPGEATDRVITIAGQPEVQIAGFTIRHGRVPDWGGGLFNDGGLLTLTNVTFSHNSAVAAGGIYVRNSASTISDVYFNSNSAGSNGGGMFIYSGTHVFLSNVTFSDNKAGNQGGGIYNRGSAVLNDIIFYGNSAEYGGGMISTSIFGSSALLSNVIFDSNIAIVSGGGIYKVFNSNLTMTEVAFINNIAHQYGGGYFNDLGGTVSLSYVSFSGNQAEYGGGMYNNGGESILNGVVFSGNQASVNGGGMYNNNGSTPVLKNSTFNGNTALTGGGLINENGSAPILTNVVFSDNTAAFGGGMLNLNNSHPSLTNVTISGNSAGFFGGGIRNSENSTLIITNSIIWGNTAGSGNEIHNSGSSSVELQYCLYKNEPGDIGEGGGFIVDEHSLTVDPLFVDAASGDLRLQEGSPAIDAGDPDTDLSLFPKNESDVPIDLDGNSRVNNGGIDIGAYEFHVLVTLDAPQLLSPSDNADDVGQSATLQWGSIAGAESYRIQLTLSGDSFDEALYDETVTDTEYEAAGLQPQTQYRWRIRALAGETESPWSEVWSFATGTVTSVKKLTDLPDKFILHQNYPNPFNPSTVIRYGLPERSAVELTVVDILGRVIAILVDGEQSPGEYEVHFEAGDLASGVYLYRLQVYNHGTGRAEPHVYTRKMMIIK